MLEDKLQPVSDDLGITWHGPQRRDDLINAYINHRRHQISDNYDDLTPTEKAETSKATYMNKRFDKQALRDEAQTHLPDMQYIGTDLIEPDTHALIGVTFAHEPTSEPIETQRHADRAAERLAIRHDSTNHIQVYELTITDDIHAMSHLLGNPPYDTDQIIIDDPPVYDEIKNAFTGIETYDTIPEAFQYAIETLRA